MTQSDAAKPADISFDSIVKKELRNRLHTKFIQYDCFTFSDTHVSITCRISGDSISIAVPFIIYAEAGKYRLLFRNTEVEGTIQTLISYLVSSLRREQSKLAKFKNQT